ncbi:hypothetical protein Asi02nite_69330 [Asanoa siamensis]|uniref:Probable transposase IS891/IS1136/IS1341 domain-containing protein n=2 Tax=Asanoa siamensis TaxID=926357 RepID=A0ABQ4D1J7_9ACTN|nr:hypothetical protein Asi02nite_69330 [Asanoa siamensis]
MVRHAGLSRFVENFCLDKILDALAARRAEEERGVAAAERTKVPWTAMDLERLWRSEHPTVAPWFAESKLSSRVPKEACRLRAVGLMNWWKSRKGDRKGPKANFPRRRKRKHGSRFRYDADRAKPAGARTVALPGIPGGVTTREDMSWLTDRVAAGRARVIGATVREKAGRWWVSFQIEVERRDVNARRMISADMPACGIDLGLTTFAVIQDDTGEVADIVAPKPLKTALRKLRRANKALSRKEAQSRNRRRAHLHVAALHLRVAARRGDFLHKLTTELARTKRAIAVESLNIAGIASNRRLARAVWSIPR